MGNLYNMINGVNPATFYILPMLGNHPDWYPRFRDCWVENGQIAVLTRVGSLNKNSGYEEKKIIQPPRIHKRHRSPRRPYLRDILFQSPGEMEN